MLVHVVASLAAAAGVPAVGTADIIIVIWYALILVRRFKDIGWPGWIAALIVIATTVVIPLGLVPYAIANKLPDAQFMALLRTVGLFSSGVNLVLLIVAGSVKGRPAAVVAQAAPDVAAVPAPAEVGASPMLPDTVVERRRPDPLTVGTVAVAAVVVLGLIVAWRFPQQRATQASSSPTVSLPPVMNSPDNQVQSNGLTKNTNDFLRQLSQQPRAGNR
ncbi:hypothetical protein IC762_34930 [Bradyrhizobium genosp. L]|uniref:hypothetical protein n=1 Tax=Bradyrhizobium genosp. L TaxID=83637 RepID=UPI0018A31D19|nr:hypothetical protein [Bradyrhizobium genosp. L]QPF84725.1 hypothetical protein IC762_34930 [Bradyrhizobium genosp. L]